MHPSRSLAPKPCSAHTQRRDQGLQCLPSSPQGPCSISATEGVGGTRTSSSPSGCISGMWLRLSREVWAEPSRGAARPPHSGPSCAATLAALHPTTASSSHAPPQSVAGLCLAQGLLTCRGQLPSDTGWPPRRPGSTTGHVGPMHVCRGRVACGSRGLTVLGTEGSRQSLVRHQLGTEDEAGGPTGPEAQTLKFSDTNLTLSFLTDSFGLDLRF